MPNRVMPTPSIGNHLFIIKAFAAANPIFCFNLWNEPACRESSLAYLITRFLTQAACPSAILGQPLRVKDFFYRLDKPPELSTCPPVTPVTHVFPVYAEELDAGLMVPLQITPSEEWHVSDAFGTFGFADRCQKNISQVLDELLQRIEQICLDLHPGRVLPLRWRRSFTLKLLCPVHFNAIEGESLQVPLVISLLRAISEKPASERSEAGMPFQNVPVFATGTLQPDHSFGPIGGLEKKLDGFIREYGEGLSAVLTSLQIQQLETGEHGKNLIKAVVVHRADNLKQLLALPELEVGLKRLCGAPHPTEIDELLSSMQRMQRGIRFDDVEAMSRWLLPYVESPVYRFQLVRKAGMVFTHRGMFPQAQSRFLQAGDILSQNGGKFGTTEKIQLATAWGTLAFDACDSAPAEPLLRAVEVELPYACIADRARYWGTCCQLYRLSGQLDEAVKAGCLAIECADLALASEGGRDRNYLIHALIARARSNPATKAKDLDEASKILRQSQVEWAPRNNTAAQRSHLGFCLHYEAEIARLQERTFRPPDAPPWFGPWGHPWMFVLLSCARNISHTETDRIRYARGLVLHAEKLAKNPASLFYLLLAIYRIYLQALLTGDIAVPLSDLNNWCQRMQARGFPGWQQRLGPAIETVARGMEGSVEMLCDAVPYH